MNKATRFYFRTLLLPFVATLAAAPAATAAVVLSNLTEAVEDADPISTASWSANRFVTDNSAAAFLLEGVTLRMATPSPPVATLSGGSFFPTAGAGGFAVALYSNSANLPGTILATLTGDSDPAAPGDYTYTAGGLTLQPGTSYWIVVGVLSGAGTYGWGWTGSSAFTGPWSIPLTETYTLSEDGGLTWDTPAWDTEPFLFSVSAAPVPEPGHYAALCAAGALGLALWRRKRARA